MNELSCFVYKNIDTFEVVLYVIFMILKISYLTPIFHRLPCESVKDHMDKTILIIFVSVGLSRERGRNRY